MECCLDLLNVPLLHDKALNHILPPSLPHLSEQLLMVLLALSRVLELVSPRLLMVSELQRERLWQVCRDRLEQGLERRVFW